MFASDLDKSTQALLERGQRTTEILKQDQYSPLPVEKQIVIIFAATNGFLDSLPVADLPPLREGAPTASSTRTTRTCSPTIREKKDIKGELTEKIKAVLTAFGSDVPVHRDWRAPRRSQHRQA